MATNTVTPLHSLIAVLIPLKNVKSENLKLFPTRIFQSVKVKAAEENFNTQGNKKIVDIS
ncbi:hypothetical protein RUM43_012715, partial [Polyplax serrata]